MISFAGNITFPKAQPIRDAAKEVPLERMFIETDSPFLAPVPHRGKRNEPAFVKEVARQWARFAGLSTEEVGGSTAANFYNFFRLDRYSRQSSESFQIFDRGTTKGGFGIRTARESSRMQRTAALKPLLLIPSKVTFS